MEKSDLIGKIERAIDELGAYGVNALIAIGGIDFEKGKLFSPAKLDHPLPISSEQFSGGILKMYTCTHTIHTFCELYAEMFPEDNKINLVNQMMHVIDEDLLGISNLMLQYRGPQPMIEDQKELIRRSQYIRHLLGSEKNFVEKFLRS